MEEENYNDDTPYVDTNASTVAFEADPVLDEFQTPKEQARWLRELESARKNRRAFNDEGVKTIQRYSGRQDGERAAPFPTSNYNLFYSNIELLKAQLFVRTPEPVVERRWDDPEDDVARVAAQRLQRNIAYELDCEGKFAQAFDQILFNRLVPGIGIGWLRLDEEIGEPELAQVHDPRTGEVIEQAVPGSEIKYQFAEIDYVAWDDFLWSPCQVWTECRWVARRIPMNKKDVRARFLETAGSEVIAQLSFSEDSEDGTDNKASNAKQIKPKHTTEKTCDIFEIWDKESRKVFWIADQATVPLDVRADTTDFPGFYPTPLPPLARFNTSNTIPISDYSQVRGLYLQLDDLQERITAMTDALQVRWTYDAQNTALRDLFTTTGNLQGIPVENWAVHMGEKGGIKGSMDFAPLGDVVAAYQQLLVSQENVKQRIFEIEGISDLMRGQSQAYDSAGATAAKQQFGTSRLNTLQRQAAAYAEKLVQLKAHLICKFYKPEFILDRSGMVAQADQQYIPAAMELLKQNPMRHWRLEVSVDSIQDPSWNMERQSRTEVVQAVSMMLSQILPIAQTNPTAAELGAHLLKFALAGYKGGADIEGYLDQAFEQMKQAAAQGAQQPQQPTDAQVKAQADMAQAQLKSQTELQKQTIQTQGDLQVAQQQAQIDVLNAQLKARDLDLKAAELQLRARGLS